MMRFTRLTGNEAHHVPASNLTLPPLNHRRGWKFVDEKFVNTKDGLVAATPFNGANARVMKQVQTQPFQHYHASVWIKTEEFASKVEIKVLNDRNDNLSYTYLNAKPTQDWTEHHITFNSLDNERLNLYIGVWGPKSGKLWLRDARLESTGAVNMVRRSTAPIRVQLVQERNWSTCKRDATLMPGMIRNWGMCPSRRISKLASATSDRAQA